MDGKWEVYETPDVGDDVTSSGVPTGHQLEGSRRRSITTEIGDLNVGPVPPPEQVFEVFAGRRYVAGPRPEVTTATKDKNLGKYVTESPYERFNRLRMEVEELVNDLKQGNDADGNVTVHSQAYSELADGVGTLQSMLEQLESDAHLSTLLSNHPEGGSGEVNSKEKAAALLKKLVEKENNGNQGNNGSTSVQYDLFYSTEQDTSHNSKLLARIDRLEKILGINGDQPLDKPLGKPLAKIVTEMEEKLSLLDEGRLAQLSLKAKSFSANVDDLARSRQRAKVGNSEKELTAIMEKLDKCDSIGSVLPTIIERLRTVQEIHQHNANVHVRLDQIDHSYSELTEAARLDRELLENLKQGMKENVEIVQQHLQQISK